jgi:hypothetical protein
MQTTEARAIFDAVIATTTSPDERAKRELLREWFTNPDFRAALAVEVARLNGEA